jgi:translation initiation factor 1A
MGKNTKGGKNFKKHKKGNPKERELIFREDEQSYARIIKQYGDGRFECQIFDFDINTSITGKICGSLRKKVWIKTGDIVLVSLRNFDSSSCDIIHKYSDDEARDLKNYGEIPSNINLLASNIELAEGKLKCDDEDNEFIFEDV